MKLNTNFALAAILPMLFVTGIAVAQSTSVKGVINGRDGATMMVQTPDSETVKVLLTPATNVVEPEGVFRKKHYSMTALIPGLYVEVKGSLNAQNQVVADNVTFHGSDFKTAQDIQAGIAPTNQQVQQTQQQVQAQRQELIAQQQQAAQAQKELQTQQQQLQKQKAQIAAEQK